MNTYIITFGNEHKAELGNGKFIIVPIVQGSYTLQANDRITAIARFDANFPNFTIMAIVNKTANRVEFDRYAIVGME